MPGVADPRRPGLAAAHRATADTAVSRRGRRGAVCPAHPPRDRDVGLLGAHRPGRVAGAVPRPVDRTAPVDRRAGRAGRRRADGARPRRRRAEGGARRRLCDRGRAGLADRTGAPGAGAGHGGGAGAAGPQLRQPGPASSRRLHLRGQPGIRGGWRRSSACGSRRARAATPCIATTGGSTGASTPCSPTSTGPDRLLRRAPSDPWPGRNPRSNRQRAPTRRVRRARRRGRRSASGRRGRPRSARSPGTPHAAVAGSRRRSPRAGPRRAGHRSGPARR